MNKMITFAVIAGGALTLAACGGNTQETPDEATDTEAMAPAEEAPATDEAAEAAEGIDPNGNPIGPAAEAE